MQDRKRETADALQNVGGDSSRKRRAITHTSIIITRSGAVCKNKKLSAQRVFFGLVWNINKPTIDELSSEGIT